MAGEVEEGQQLEQGWTGSGVSSEAPPLNTITNRENTESARAFPSVRSTVRDRPVKRRSLASLWALDQLLDISSLCSSISSSLFLRECTSLWSVLLFSFSSSSFLCRRTEHRVHQLQEHNVNDDTRVRMYGLITDRKKSYVCNVCGNTAPEFSCLEAFSLVFELLVFSFIFTALSL